MKSRKCPTNAVYGPYMTSEKRKEMFGNISGGALTVNMEKYQRKMVCLGTHLCCEKTKIRINYRLNTLVEKASLSGEYRFDFTEDFDGVQEINNKTIYINFKCCAGSGGNQTRTLRNCNHFIEAQLNIVKTCDDIYFANILDGDICHDRMTCFNRTRNLYPAQKDRVYVGNLKDYFSWFNKINDISE